MRSASGGAADFVALRIDDPREFGWQFGGNLAALVVKDGLVIPSGANFVSAVEGSTKP